VSEHDTTADGGGAPTEPVASTQPQEGHQSKSDPLQHIAKLAGELGKMRKQIAAMKRAGPSLPESDEEEAPKAAAPSSPGGDVGRLARSLAVRDALDDFDLTGEQRKFIRAQVEGSNVAPEDVQEHVAGLVQTMARLWGGAPSTQPTAPPKPKTREPAPEVAAPAGSGPALSDNPRTWDDSNTRGLSSRELYQRFKQYQQTSGSTANLAAARKQGR
jgi:hypothetical protein